MSKKEKRIEEENALLAKVYDLILNTETADDERSMLVEFKNSVESGKDFKKNIMKLAEDLRLLALNKHNHKETLTKEVGKFYMDISTIGFFEKNLGYGISVLGTVLSTH